MYDPFKDDLLEMEKRLISKLSPQSCGETNSSFTPVVNRREGEFAYHLEIDIPGVKKEDISVDIKDDMLSVSGERKYKNEVKKDDYYKMESGYGKFERSFFLPKSVDSENITASCEDGVLEVVLPKLSVGSEKNKKVDIK